MIKKALFLDRDGVINIDKSYVYRWEDFEFIPEIFDIIKTARERNYLVIVLTNQSGIARGMYQEADVLKLHKKINEELSKQNLAIDEFFFCPDFSEKYRKPAPGMMLDAVSRFNIDLNHSIMVGDKPSDLIDLSEHGQFDLKTFLIQGNYTLNLELKNQKNVTICRDHKELKSLLAKSL